MRVKVCLSLDEATVERLKQYAAEQHLNVSSAVTQWIWSAKVVGSDPKGQQTISGAVRAAKRKESKA